jgi:hypothetical protein
MQELLWDCIMDGRPCHGTPVPQERQAALLADFEAWRQAARLEHCDESCSETATTASDPNDVGFLDSDFSDEDA